MEKLNHQPFSFSQQGSISCGRQVASPNCDDRPDHCDIDMIVIHNISLPPKIYGGNGIIELFTNKLNPDEHPYYAEIYTAQVSSHFLIRRDGELIQFVPCAKRAWHAGVSQWQNRESCNDFSVGIELEGCDFEIFEAAQYKTLNALIKSLKEAYPIQHIVGHSDIAPGRKTDPGPFFDWDKVAGKKD
ncbi:MAG: 1,6-anhydro-N-acetylmuramyl-L-alanine amidase AmpD [Methylophilaceae bacterium]